MDVIEFNVYIFMDIALLFISCGMEFRKFRRAIAIVTALPKVEKNVISTLFYRIEKSFCGEGVSVGCVTSM